LTQLKSVKCFGENAFGQLGYGDVNNRGDSVNQMGNYLQALNLGGETLSTGGGYEHSCALLSNLKVKCWGRNQNGVLGYEDSVDRGGAANHMGDYLPEIDLGTNIFATKLGVGYQGNMILTFDGKLKAWGRSVEGQLGAGTAFAIGDNNAEMGNNLAFVNIGSGRKTLQFSLQSRQCCVLLDNQDHKCFGQNDFGQLGQGNVENLGNEGSEMGDYLNPINYPSGTIIRNIGGGHFYSGAINYEGDLYMFGYRPNSRPLHFIHFKSKMQHAIYTFYPLLTHLKCS